MAPTIIMEFFAAAIDTLKVLVIALGAGLGVWGVINLLEGYGNDNPGAKSQGMKQLMAVNSCGKSFLSFAFAGGLEPLSRFPHA